MNKEPQPTTHNVERGARSTFRERSETGSSLKRTRKKVSCSLIGERSWRFGTKCLATLEQTCGEIHWRFVENIFGDLEKTYSAILGENLSAFCLANLEKSFGASFGETYSAKSFGDLEKSFGASFGDLEKSFSDLEKSCSTIWRNRSVIWRNCSAIWRKHGRRSYGNYVLEFIMK